jgi:hypothetical protein
LAMLDWIAVIFVPIDSVASAVLFARSLTS